MLKLLKNYPRLAKKLKNLAYLIEEGNLHEKFNKGYELKILQLNI
jgi:hypothetical protein